MTRAVTGAMQTHLNLSVTTLTSLWEVVRTDGVTLRFTEHDRDILSGGVVYQSSVGYKRSPVDNKAGLSVDNLEVAGFLDSSLITASDLRAGKYDGATVRLSIVNWADTSMGEIKIRKGRLGEVVYSEKTGRFTSELRGMTSRMSQVILQIYQFECRADLGAPLSCRNDFVLGVDGRGVVIWPAKELRNTTYAVGDAVIEGIQTATDEWDVIFNYDTDLVDRGPANYGPTTQGGSVGLGTGHFNNGVVFSPSNRFDTAYDLGYSRVAAQFSPGPLTIECWFNRTNPASVDSEALLAWAGGNYLTSSTNIWILGIVNATDVAFILFDGGSSGSKHFTLQGTMPLGAHDSSDHHIAVTRDGSNVWRLFIDGTQIASLTDSATFENPALYEFRVGSREHTGGDYERFKGMIDDVRLLHGFAAYTAAFAAPGAPHTVGVDLTSDDLGGDIYHECTVAGLSSSTKPTFATVVGNTTVDGTMTWTTRNAFTRHGEVDAVTDNQNFDSTVTEPRAVNGWFQFGAVIWETGNNKGLVMEVKNWTQTAGVVELYLSMPLLIQVGDKFRIYTGCDKKLATCRDKFSNVVNFRGEPHIPGTDFAMKVPDGKRSG